MTSNHLSSTSPGSEHFEVVSSGPLARLRLRNANGRTKRRTSADSSVGDESERKQQNRKDTNDNDNDNNNRSKASRTNQFDETNDIEVVKKDSGFDSLNEGRFSSKDEQASNRMRETDSDVMNEARELPRDFRLVVGVRDGIHAAEATLLVTIIKPQELTQLSGENALERTCGDACLLFNDRISNLFNTVSSKCLLHQQSMFLLADALVRPRIF